MIGQTKRIRRALCAVLQPLTGSRSVGALTVKSASATPVLVPKGTFWLPIPVSAAGTAEIARHRPIITTAATTVSQAGTTVPVTSLLGGLRQNLSKEWGVAPTLTPILCRLDPPVTGLVQTAAVQTALTGGLDATGPGSVKEVVCFDSFGTREEATEAFLARAMDGLSIIVAWSGSGRSTSSGRNRTQRPDSWEIYVVCPNRNVSEVRTDEVTDVLDGVEGLLTERGCADEFVFSAPPAVVTGRRLTKVTPTSTIYCLTLETTMGVERTEVRTGAWSSWTKSKHTISIAAEGVIAELPVVDSAVYPMS
jgi:hypothetical protein